MRIAPEDLCGLRLLGLTTSWHEFDGERTHDPVHVWLTFAGIGPVQLHTPSDGDLQLTVSDPYDSCDMGEAGCLVVEAGFAALDPWLGHRVGRVTRLFQTPPDLAVGAALHFGDDAIGMADLGDEIAVERWPSDRWTQWGVHPVRRHRDRWLRAPSLPWKS